MEQTFEDAWEASGLDLDKTQDFDQTIRAPVEASGISSLLPQLSVVDADALEPGKPSQLVVGRLLGRGGIGQVHEAREPLLDRSVAIKRVHPEAPATATANLLREARTMGGLDHPNIVPVHTLGTDAAGRPILVMKRIEGVLWLDLIGDPEHEAWSWWTGLSEEPLARHVELLVSVSRAVQFAHQRGVLHGDLKPQNAMLSRDGGVYVLDWGLARPLSQRGEHAICGTPCYMAPEMVDREAPLTRATDVYMLGGCLYQVLTGLPPHVGTTLREVLHQAREALPPELPAELAPRLAAICTRAMAPDPSHRYPTVDALVADLSDWLRTRGSDELTQLAMGRLAVLSGRLHEQPLDPGAVARAFAEARFGFRRALDDWPENPVARTGLRTATIEMIRFEIQRNNPDYADTLLSDLDPNDPDLPSLERLVEKGRARLEELRAIAKERDLSVSQIQRTAVLGMVALVSVMVSGVLMAGGSSDASHVDSWTLVLIELGISSINWIVVLVLWRWLKVNAVNRAIALTVAWVTLAVFSSRIAAHLGALPAGAPFAIELLILGGAVGTVAAFLEARGLVVGALGLLAGALGTAALPEHALTIYGLTASGAFLLVAGWWWFSRSTGWRQSTG